MRYRAWYEREMEISLEKTREFPNRRDNLFPIGNQLDMEFKQILASIFSLSFSTIIA